MKALSIREPWCWLILHYKGRDPKRIENRKWNTHFRGDFLIHASLTYDQQGADWVQTRFGIHCPPPEKLSLGGIVGMVRLVGVTTASHSRWFFGPFGFELAKPYPMPFVPYRGQMGFFEYQDL